MRSMNASEEVEFNFSNLPIFQSCGVKYRGRGSVCQDEKPFVNYCLTGVTVIVYSSRHSLGTFNETEFKVGM
jgi:hypothetical protein